MYIWDYKIKSKKLDPRWKLERMINYGLEKGEKLPRKELIKYWNDLKIDAEKKAFLKLILWPKKF